LTRPGGSWIIDGFAAGQTIVISGTQFNNGTRTIKAISATTLTFAGDSLVNETGAATLSSAVPDRPDFAGGTNDIVFRARRIGTPEIENLLPSGYLSKTVSIEIGQQANLYAGSIYLVTQAEDRSINDQIGVTTSAFLQQGVIEPIQEIIEGLFSLPMKV